MKGGAESELESARFDDEAVDGVVTIFVLQEGLRHGNADVAAWRTVEPALGEEVSGEACRSRFTVGSGDGDDRRLSGVGGEFEFGEDGNISFGGMGEDGQRRFEPWARDDSRRAADGVSSEDEFRRWGEF